MCVRGIPSLVRTQSKAAYNMFSTKKTKLVVNVHFQEKYVNELKQFNSFIADVLSLEPQCFLLDMLELEAGEPGCWE